MVFFRPMVSSSMHFNTRVELPNQRHGQETRQSSYSQKFPTVVPV